MFEVTKYEVSRDSDGNELEGDNYYKFHLPPKIPVKEFWSVLVFDAQTRLLIKNKMPWPSVNARQKKLVISDDGSVEIYFGPRVSNFNNTNWIQTMPNQKWYMVLNLYEPLEAELDKIWKPDNIKKVMSFKSMSSY
jgi:hypothetical protein